MLKYFVSFLRLILYYRKSKQHISVSQSSWNKVLSFSVSHWLIENTVFRVQLLMISLSFFPLSFSFPPTYYKGGVCCPLPLRAEGKHYLSQWQNCHHRDAEDKQAWLFEQRWQGTGVRNWGCRLNEQEAQRGYKEQSGFRSFCKLSDNLCTNTWGLEVCVSVKVFFLLQQPGTSCLMNDFLTALEKSLQQLDNSSLQWASSVGENLYARFRKSLMEILNSGR